MLCFGSAFFSSLYPTYRYCFDQQHANDELCFSTTLAADPSIDYSNSSNVRRVPHIWLHSDLTDFGSNKEVALIFGFDADVDARILIYSFGGLLADVTLTAGDNQFLIEVEGLYLSLFFLHSRHEGSSLGGQWFFKGITAYVI
jgi:hypothetical protein